MHVSYFSSLWTGIIILTAMIAIAIIAVRMIFMDLFDYINLQQNKGFHSILV